MNEGVILPAWLEDLIYQLVYHASKAVLAPLQRNSDFYWPFLLSTLLIGWIAWRFWSSDHGSRGPAPWKAFRARYLSRELWWHPSARVDYRFYLANAVFVPLALGPLILQGSSVSEMLEHAFGSASAATTSPEYRIAARLLYSLLFFLAYDFGRFLAHSLLHDLPWLWEFHKVHHSAEVLTPLTAARVHPFDLAIMACVPALLTGTLTWCFHRWVDSGIEFYTFLGMHVLLWMFGLIDNLRHWQVWISYGSALNRWLISPAHHQLHHSAEREHWGCNRGFELAIWDRLYGTLRVPPDQQLNLRFGLGDDTDGCWRSVSRLYFWPFGLLARRMSRRAPKSAAAGTEQY